MSGKQWRKQNKSKNDKQDGSTWPVTWRPQNYNKLQSYGCLIEYSTKDLHVHILWIKCRILINIKSLNYKRLVFAIR